MDLSRHQRKKRSRKNCSSLLSFSAVSLVLTANFCCLLSDAAESFSLQRQSRARSEPKRRRAFPVPFFCSLSWQLDLIELSIAFHLKDERRGLIASHLLHLFPPPRDMTKRFPAIFICHRHIKAADRMLFDGKNFVWQQVELAILTEHYPLSRSHNRHPLIVLHILRESFLLMPLYQKRGTHGMNRFRQPSAERSVEIKN